MSAASETFVEPEWLWDLLGARADARGIELDGQRWQIVDGIPRAPGSISAAQQQTSGTFGYKWAKRETFEGFVGTFSQQWLRERYGRFGDETFVEEHGPQPVFLDAGCGAALSALALYSRGMHRLRYLGVDVSTAVDVAATRLIEHGIRGALLQSDLMSIPLPDNSVDIIFSEGVLHHTDDTRKALERLVRHLKSRGRVLFYVYRQKGPIREFTDDHIRERLRDLPPEEAWQALEPLTALGIQLGELGIELDIQQPIDVLDIPAGKLDLQRFFYWHVFKAFYRPEMTFDEMQHINFDWYTPTNAHRHTPEEVRSWCADLDLHIEHEQVEEAGITIVARKRG